MYLNYVLVESSYVVLRSTYRYDDATDDGRANAEIAARSSEIEPRKAKVRPPLPGSSICSYLLRTSREACFASPKRLRLLELS